MDTSTNLHRMILITILLLCIGSFRSYGQQLDILAFEYTRKFPTLSSLDIGKCAYTIEEVLPGYAVTKTCDLPRVYGPITSPPKQLNDSQNIEVGKYNDIFTYMGLCGSDTATKLGLLSRGDCLAVEIGSNLTFNKKTYIRAYIEYYRHDIDILLSDMTSVPLALQGQYINDYFVKYMSYGSLEIVIVQFKFKKKQQATILRKSKFNSLFLSDWMRYVERDIETPAETKVIRLSTARKQVELTRFKSKVYNKAMSKVQKYEGEIYDTRESIRRQNIRPHLQYGLYPYTPGKMGQFRSSQERVSWEKVSTLEININRALTTQKSIKRNCKKANLPECEDVKKMNKTLKKIKKYVHEERRKWCKLSDTEQQNTIKTYTKKLKKQVRLQNKLKKVIKVWKKEQSDLQKSARKKRRLKHRMNKRQKYKKLASKRKNLNIISA